MKSAELDEGAAIAAAADETIPESRSFTGPESLAGERAFEFARPSVAIVAAGRLGGWHLPRGRSLSSTCEILNRRNVNYVVLPAAVGPGTALLVSDEDIPRIRDLVTRVPLGEPLAVYAITDLPGFSFQQHWRHIADPTNMTVLPPFLANELLERATVDERGSRVPAAGDLLLWAIYRALFLAGDDYFAPGTSSDATPILVGPQVRLIRELAQKTATDLTEPFTLAALHEHLAKSGWEPPFDVLKRISPWNSWAAFKVREREESRQGEEPGMAVFLVRRAAFENGIAADIVKIIEAAGFEVLKTIDLDERQGDAAARAMRGGNWGPGAFAVNGGPPCQILIAYDVLPVPVHESVRDRYPHMDNGHIIEAKLRCRGFIRERFAHNRRFNPVHSTDESGHAWEVVRMFAADEEPKFRDLIDRRKAAFHTQFEVVRSLTRTGLRSKIEVIRYKGGLAVKKTFRETFLRLMEREASFMEAVSPHRSEIPPVLERGPNYIIMPYIEGRTLRRFVFGRGIPMLLTLKQVRQLADLLRYLCANGYDAVDVGPHNLLVDRTGEMRAIDFEFVHKAKGPIDLTQAACLNGIPKDFEGEWPPKALWNPSLAKSMDPWRLRWFGCVGLSRDSFLHDPPWIQHLKRTVNYPAYLGRKAMENQIDWLRTRARNVVKLRLPVISRMVANAFRTKGAWS